MPYWLGGSENFARWFDGRRHTTLIVRPRKIFKFREAKISAFRSSEWSAVKQRIHEVMPKSEVGRREFVSMACRLARDWNALGVEQRERVRPVFMERLETSPVLEDVPGGCRRQTFVLVAIFSRRTADFDAFKRAIVRGWLCDLQEIRTVYEVEVAGEEPDVPWKYWVDIIAEPDRTDRIVDELIERAAELGIKAGTRSMDRTRYLKLHSVEGLAESEGLSEIVSFLEDSDLVALWGERGLDLDTTRLAERRESAVRIARAYRVQMEELETDVDRRIRRWLVEFYGWWFCGNFCKSLDRREARLLDAASAGFAVYRAIEVAVKRLLQAREGPDYRRSLITRLAQTGERGRAQAVRDNIVRMGFFAMSLWGREGVPQWDEVRALGARFEQSVYTFRNDLAHEDRYRELLSLRWDDAPPNARAEAAQIERVAELVALLPAALRAFRSAMPS